MDTRKRVCLLLALCLGFVPVIGAYGQEDTGAIELRAGDYVPQPDGDILTEDTADTFSSLPMDVDIIPREEPYEIPYEAPVAVEIEDTVIEEPEAPEPVEAQAYVALEQTQQQAAVHAGSGETVTLAVPMLVDCGGVRVATNQDIEGYALGYGAAGEYTQWPAQHVAWATLRLDTPVDGTMGMPLRAGEGFLAEAPLVDENGSRGYAVFAGLYVPDDAQPGEYTLNLTATWQPLGEEATQTCGVTARLVVQGDAQAMSPQSILTTLEEDEVSAVIAWNPEDILVTEPEAAEPEVNEPEVIEPEPNEADIEASAPGELLVEQSAIEPGVMLDDDVDTITSATPSVSDMQMRIQPIGDALTGRQIAVPVAVTVNWGNDTWSSNVGNDGSVIAYGGGGFTENLPSNVSNLKVTLVTESLEDEDCPFQLAEGGVTEMWLIEDGVNHGYAVFDCFIVKRNAQAGDYPFTFKLSWSTWPEGSEDWAQESEAAAPQEEAAPQEGVLETIGRGLRSLFGISTASAEGIENSLIVDEVISLLGVLSGKWIYSSSATDGSAYLILAEEPTTAIVFSYAQLSAAVKAGKTYIYIGHSTDANTAVGEAYEGMPVNNGTLTYDRVSSGLYLPQSGGTFVLDGRDPEFVDAPIATVVDWAASAQAYVFTFASTTATFRNLVWDGANIYGIATAGASCTVYFENVTYDGVQMFYGPTAGTTAVISGCNITIQPNARMSATLVEEFMELTGGVTFTGADSSLTFYTAVGNEAIYNMANTSSFFFRVDAGTNVDIWSQTHLMYSSIAEMTIDGNLTLNLSGPNGGVFYTTNSAKNLTVNGTLDITYTPDRNSYAALLGNVITVNGTLRVRQQPTNASTAYAVRTEGGTLAVNPGGVLEIYRAGSSGQNAAIYSTTTTFDSPERVAIYNVNGRITTAEPTITTSCLTVWQGLGDPASGGYGIGQTPSYTWNNQSMGAFTYGKGTVTGLDHGGKGVAPGAAALATGTLQFTTVVASPRYVVMGTPSLSVDPAFYGESTVTGVASGTGTVAAQYAVDDAYMATGTALRTTASGSGGNYSLQLASGETWVEQQSMVFVRAYDDGLSPWQRTEDVLKGKLALLSVPSITFEELDIAITPRLLARTCDMTAYVSDSRGYQGADGVWVPEKWQLSIRQDTDFASGQTGETIQSGMVFVRDGVTSSIAGGTDVIAAIGDSSGDGQPIPVTWADEEGLFLELLPNDPLPGNSYTATLTWTIAPYVAAE